MQEKPIASRHFLSGQMGAHSTSPLLNPLVINARITLELSPYLSGSIEWLSTKPGFILELLSIWRTTQGTVIPPATQQSLSSRDDLDCDSGSLPQLKGEQQRSIKTWT